MRARDPYTALGVPEGAGADEIKTAFRNRARLLHPDVNPSDPHATEKFKELLAAYELLCDPLRRSAYDRSGARQGQGSWDFGSVRTAYARRQPPPSPPPQEWAAARAVALRERSRLTRRRRAHAASLHRIVISPDLRRLATRRGDAVQLWDPKSGHGVARVADEEERVEALYFSPDGRWLITEGMRGTALWDARSGREFERLNLDGRGKLGFSSDGQLMASAVHTLAEVAEVDSGRTLTQIPHEAALRAIALSGDGQRVATAVHSTARVWDARSGRQLGEMLHERPVASMELSSDGRLLATSTAEVRSGWTPSWLQVWEVASGLELARLEHSCWVDQAAFSPDGQRLATNSNGRLHLWDLIGGRQLIRLNTLVSSELVFSPDGRWLAVGSGRNVHVWDVGSGHQLACLNHRAEVVSIAVSFDGTRIGTGSHDPGDREYGLAGSVLAQEWRRAERITPV